MICIGGCIYTVQRMGVALPLIINNYVNDILSIPITMSVILTIVRMWRGQTYQLSIGMIISVVIYFSFYFEYYLPKYNLRYTADLLDVCCYTIGGIIFYVLQKYLFTKNK
ncbi:MAG: hypothetical protein ACRCVU_00820 [Flavobacterium sp.]